MNGFWNMEHIYTIPEVAELLRTNRNYVYNEIKKGRLTAVRIGTMKVRERDLDKYLDKLVDEQLLRGEEPVLQY